MKYRKKPVVVEAWQYRGSISISAPQWVQDAYNSGKLYFHAKKLYVRSWEGDMLVPESNYIIQGVRGELYSCKPDIFRETYEPYRSKEKKK